MQYHEMKITEVRNLVGVKDLPLKVGGPFAQALMAESRGDRGAAAAYLDKAIAAEATV